VFNVGVGEMMVVLLVALLVFGPNKLPEIARSMGKFLRNFQQETNRALSDLKQGIEPVTTGIFDEPDPGTPTEELVVANEEPAAAFGVATAATRRKTSTRAAAGRRKPAATAKKPAATASKRAVAARKPAPKKKPVAKKKTSKR
jgi:sec-independent protein translocase protein TatB